jgi:hypothetical protein
MFLHFGIFGFMSIYSKSLLIRGWTEGTGVVHDLVYILVICATPVVSRHPLEKRDSIKNDI